jgi:uncharacterized membrane protein
MNTEQKVDAGSHGLKWGLIIGFVYAIFILLRYRFGANDFVTYGILMFVGFVVVMGLLFYSGKKARDENGGYIEMQEAFKAMFIAVLIFELFFMVATLIYLKYIDPDFFQKLRDSTESVMLATKASQADIDRALQTLEQAQAQSQYTKINVFDFLKTYLYTVGLTGLFALAFAFFLKRKPPVFQQDQFPQT